MINKKSILINFLQALCFCLFLGTSQLAVSNSWGDLDVVEPPPPDDPTDPPCLKKALCPIDPVCPRGTLCPHPQILAANSYQTIRRLLKSADISNKRNIEILNQLVAHNDPKVQIMALQTLNSIPQKASYNLIENALYSQNLEIRRLAISVLEKKNCQKCSRTLYDILNDQSELLEFRTKAAVAMGSMKYRLAVPALINTMQSNDEKLVIRSAISLANLGNRTGFVHLFVASQNAHLGEGIRIDAIRAIEKATGENFKYTRPYFAKVSIEEKNAALIKIRNWWVNYAAETNQGGR